MRFQEAKDKALTAKDSDVIGPDSGGIPSLGGTYERSKPLFYPTPE